MIIFIIIINFIKRFIRFIKRKVAGCRGACEMTRSHNMNLPDKLMRLWVKLSIFAWDSSFFPPVSLFLSLSETIRFENQLIDIEKPSQAPLH